MAWSRVNNYGPTAAASNIEALQSTVDTQRRTYDAVTLNNWSSGNTSAPTIAVGSVIEINGSVFEVDTSAITIGSVPGGATDDLYIKLTVTGGTTVTADWSTTAPTWDAAKGGWFDGTNKVLPFVVDYDGANWNNKRELVLRFNRVVFIDVDGQWAGDFTATQFISAGYGITPSGSFHSNNATEAALYSALSPYLPNVGDEIGLRGGYTDSAGNNLTAVSRAVRNTASQIYIYDIGPSGGFPTPLQVDSGGASYTLDWSISW